MINVKLVLISTATLCNFSRLGFVYGFTPHYPFWRSAICGEQSQKTWTPRDEQRLKGAPPPLGVVLPLQLAACSFLVGLCGCDHVGIMQSPSCAFCAGSSTQVRKFLLACRSDAHNVRLIPPQQHWGSGLSLEHTYGSLHLVDAISRGAGLSVPCTM